MIAPDAEHPALHVSLRGAEVLRGVASYDDLGRSDRRALREAGFVGADGSPTPAGRALRDDLVGAPVVLLYRLERGVAGARARLHVGRRQLLAIGPRDDASLDRRGASSHVDALGGPPRTVDVLPADAVPILLARWGRLEPSRETTHGPFGPYEVDAVMRRCLDPHEPAPEGLDADSAEMWRRPWRVWGAQCDERNISLTFVDVPGHGPHVVRRRGDVVSLTARPSSLLWGDLQAVLQPLVYDHELTW